MNGQLRLPCFNKYVFFNFFLHNSHSMGYEYRPLCYRYNISIGVNHQTTKKFIFFTVNRQKYRLRLTVKKFQGVQISLFQLIFTGFWLLQNLYSGKISSNVLKNALSSRNETLQPAYIWKYFELSSVKGQENVQNTTDNINPHRS